MPTSPTAPTVPTSPTPFQLSGHVRDETGVPVAEANVRIEVGSGPSRGPYSYISAVTDSAGAYRIEGAGFVNGAVASKEGYESHVRHTVVTPPSRTLAPDFRLASLIRIAAGDSATSSIGSLDLVCLNNVRDFPGLGPDYVCRTIRVTAPSPGTLTVTVVSRTAGVAPGLAIEGPGVKGYWLWTASGTATVSLTVASEVLVNVEVLDGASVTFDLSTTFVPS